MGADEQRWPFLRRKTAARLRFFAHRSRSNSMADEVGVEAVGAPCRLPGCGEWVERTSSAGRPGWFHQHQCADAFRIRQRAMDAAIDELAEEYESSTHTSRERTRLRADLEWLLEVRSTYVSPGSWKNTEPRSEEVGAQRTGYQYVAEVLRASTRAHRPDPCPTCRGTGDLSTLRPLLTLNGVKRRRDEIDILAQMASLFSRLGKIRPSLEAFEAAGLWEQRARDAERTLQRSFRTGSSPEGRVESDNAWRSTET